MVHIKGVENSAGNGEESTLETRAKLVHALFELDYILSEEIYESIKGFSESELTELRNKLVKLISLVKGDVSGAIFYPNFPKYVKTLSEDELAYYRSMNYLYYGLRLQTGNVSFDYVPSTFIEVESNEEDSITLPKMVDEIKGYLETGYDSLSKTYPEKTVIEYGTEEEAINYIKDIIDAKTSISEDMRQVLDVILEFTPEDIEAVLPETINRKEIMANVVALLVGKDEGSLEPFKKYIETTTDVLRVLDVLNGGNGSLKTFTYTKMSRTTRRFILSLLDTLNPYIVSEDMFRNTKVWKGLLKVLHPFESRFNKYGKAQKSFKIFIEGDKSHTFNHRVEKGITQLKEDGKVENLLNTLKTRPGEFGRRLDLVLRSTSETKQGVVLKEFSEVVSDISSIILYQMKSHFDNYDTNISLVETVNGFHARKSENGVSQFSQYIVKGILDTELTRRLSGFEDMGKVYLDPKLKQLKMPISLRTSSVNSSRILTRGSRIPLSNKGNVRLFTHWTNHKVKGGESSTDVDLSVALLDENKDLKHRIAYYKQRVPEFKSLVFSGDMTNAPNPTGANEFIDFNKKELLDKGIRYLTMSVIVYHVYDDNGNKISFKGLEDVTAGWVEFDSDSEDIEQLKSNRYGRVEGVEFNTRDIKNQFDIISDSTSVVPLVIDLKRDELTWIDTYAPTKGYGGTVDANKHFVKESVEYYTKDKSITMYDLLDMHIKYRNGTEVYDKDTADKVFDLETLSIPEVLSQFI